MKFPLNTRSGRINKANINNYHPSAYNNSGRVVFFVRGKGRCPLGPLSVLLIVFGILIIMALVLPTGFWWLMLGVVLILLGLQLIKTMH